MYVRKICLATIKKSVNRRPRKLTDEEGKKKQNEYIKNWAKKKKLSKVQ